MGEAIGQYRRLRDRVDLLSGRLVDLHCKHIACKAGCSDCCTDLTVSPVEYAAILQDLKEAGVRPQAIPHDPAAACAFLKGGLCGLYRFRPLICRTHGLPVAFLNDDGEEGEGPPQVNVSFCPKNFTEAEPEDLDFGPENTLGLDGLNEELAEINARYRQEAGGPTDGPAARVPLSRLREEPGQVDEPADEGRGV